MILNAGRMLFSLGYGMDAISSWNCVVQWSPEAAISDCLLPLRWPFLQFSVVGHHLHIMSDLIFYLHTGMAFVIIHNAHDKATAGDLKLFCHVSPPTTPPPFHHPFNHTAVGDS